MTLPPFPRPRLWKYYTMLFVIHTIGRMPIGWRYGISRIVSDTTFFFRKSVRDATRSNMRHVLGPEASEREVDRLARQSARNTGRYYADMVGMHNMDIRKFYEEDLDLRGLQYIIDAQAQGRGVVLASAHYANPEFAAQGLAAAGIKVFALVEPLQPPEIGRLMRGLRAVHGHQYEPIGFSAVKQALTWLRGGGLVCILMDRDIQKRGVTFDFCGAPARFPTGPVDLALRTNSVLIPGFARRAGGYKIDGDLGPPLDLIVTGDNERDLLVNTQRLLARFETYLKQDPGQWSVLEKIWPDDLARPATPAGDTPAGPATAAEKPAESQAVQ